MYAAAGAIACTVGGGSERRRSHSKSRTAEPGRANQAMLPR